MTPEERSRARLGPKWAKYRERFPTVQVYLLSKAARQPNGCLRWKTGTGRHYPEANYAGVAKSAHLMSYEAFKGPIPPGKIIRHTCDDVKCIEPEHLIPGTKKDNRRDFMERHPRARELCLEAAKIAAKGVKRFWDNMTPEQRADFISRRAETQKAKTTPEQREKHIKMRRAGLKKFRDSMSPEEKAEFYLRIGASNKANRAAR